MIQTSLNFSGGDGMKKKLTFDFFQVIMPEGSHSNLGSILKNIRVVTDNHRHQAAKTVWAKHQDALIKLFTHKTKL